MIYPLKLILLGLGFLLALTFQARAQFDDSLFKAALKIKKNAYIADGAFTGGERKNSDFRVQNVRLAANPAGYDRIVVDFAGNQLGESSNLARPPYYIVDVDGLNRRAVVTVFGKPKLDFSSQTALQMVKKTKHIKALQFLPVLNEDRWMFVIEVVKSSRIEAFDLSDPARLIVDVKLN
jgi:hypothetical protein